MNGEKDIFAKIIAGNGRNGDFAAIYRRLEERSLEKKLKNKYLC